MEPRLWCANNDQALRQCRIDLYTAMEALNSPSNSALTRKAALTDGAFAGGAAALTLVGATAIGALFLPILAGIGVGVPAIRAAFQKSAGDGNAMTYFAAQRLIENTEGLIQDLCGRPGTSYMIYPRPNDERWAGVEAHISTIRGLIQVLQGKGNYVVVG